MVENTGLRFPLNAQIEVTEECIHKCFYCYNHWIKDNSKNKISKEKSRRLMEILFEEIKPFDTVITGGEPLMNMPASLEIASSLYKRRAICSMNTNFVLMNKYKLSKLKEANPEMSFLVSLPSIKEEIFTQITGKNTLNKVLTNLEGVLSEDMKVTINMVVHRLNKDLVYDEGEFLVKNFGIESFAATPVLKPSFREANGNYLNKDETISVLRDLLRIKNDFGIKVNVLEVIPYCYLPEDLRSDFTFRRSCGAGRATIQISYNGDVRTCGHSPYTEGNIFINSFRDIWDNLNKFRQNKYIPEDCKECVEVVSCCGGCRYEGLQEGQLLDKKDSRMIGKLDKKVRLDNLPKIEENLTYKLNLYGTRKEKEDNYILYNGSILLVNEDMKNFVEYIRNTGFRLNSFPENLKNKAETFGRILKAGGFLI